MLTLQCPACAFWFVCVKWQATLFFYRWDSDGSTCSTKDGSLSRTIYEMLHKYKGSKAIWGNKWHVKCCSDTISTWYRWFEPAGLVVGAATNKGLSCGEKAALQPTAAELMEEQAESPCRGLPATAAAPGRSCPGRRFHGGGSVCIPASASRPGACGGPWAPGGCPGEQTVLEGAAPAPMVLRVALPWPRCPCQFPSIASWVWNKLASMAPALILRGRIPSDSRAITGRAAVPGVVSSPPRRREGSGGSASGAAPRGPSQRWQLVHSPASGRAPPLAPGGGTECPVVAKLTVLICVLQKGWKTSPRQGAVFISYVSYEYWL